MKKFLLLGAAALMVFSVNAQLKRSEMSVRKAPQIERLAKSATTQEMQMRTPGTAVAKAPKKSSYLEPFYRRPAGAFYSPCIAVDGNGSYTWGDDFLLLKPFNAYTFKSFVDGADEETDYEWEVYINDETYYLDHEPDLVVDYSLSIEDIPLLWATTKNIDDPDAGWYMYQMLDHTMGGSSEAPVVESEKPVQIFSIAAPSQITEEEGVDILLTSKTAVGGGRNGDNYYKYTSYYGATPHGHNKNGWWFGKNGAHIDGLAQAFEKPERPYMLNKVYLMIGDDAILNGPVKFTCKVYKLDEIPAYNDTAAVALPEEPGELIVTGEGTLSPESLQSKNGFIEFTLYGHDEDDPELTYEYSPTVDYPILVCIDGYNDESMDDLVEFMAYISTDDQVDEGYGELAYLKYPIYEVNENNDTVFTGNYYWRGLNNFFRSGTMKTGLSIYISADMPFLTFNYGLEDGEFTFPDEGGVMEKALEYSDTTVYTRSIEFFSWVPSGDGDWLVTYNGVDELPDWLDIELEDVEEYETGWGVNALVTADPLPEGTEFRKATVRFEIPGDYIEYTFKQGVEPPSLYGDVNGDGEVNIADVNAVISCILSGGQSIYNCDVNGDGEINIADVNAVITVILGM